VKKEDMLGEIRQLQCATRPVPRCTQKAMNGVFEAKTSKAIQIRENFLFRSNPKSFVSPGLAVRLRHHFELRVKAKSM
jgi:hypothetical protein